MTSSPRQPSRRRIPVIGLVGGIGSGKSEVARVLESLGCVVLDSDAQAKAMLDRDDVRRELVSWWGPDILSKPAGSDPGAARAIDRAAVARIIFSDPAQRTRLERLIHPLLHQQRRARIESLELAAPAPPAIVIDAPLLIEAGVDRECDVLVFVDAPRAQRVRRVRETRGWDEAELARREAAQMPLDTKRARCQHHVRNDGSLESLRAQVAGMLTRMRADLAANSVARGPDSELN
ncbi:MAG: dephospho-CoA kinase [Phycisphaerales bacterium]